jgi:hypothetical protein
MDDTQSWRPRKWRLGCFIVVIRHLARAIFDCILLGMGRIFTGELSWLILALGTLFTIGNL